MLYHRYMEQTVLRPTVKVGGAAIVLIGILAQSGGFFLHMVVGQPGAPSIGTTVTYLGAALLAAAVLLLVCIAAALQQIFDDHQTAAYLGIVREVRFLTPEVAVLRAVVGMVRQGQSDLNPAANAVQTLVAVRQETSWQIAVFHNTPAAFHGRPELAEALTQELRDLLRSKGLPKSDS